MKNCRGLNWFGPLLRVGNWKKKIEWNVIQRNAFLFEAFHFCAVVFSFLLSLNNLNNLINNNNNNFLIAFLSIEALLLCYFLQKTYKVSGAYWWIWYKSDSILFQIVFSFCACLCLTSKTICVNIEHYKIHAFKAIYFYKWNFQQDKSWTLSVYGHVIKQIRFYQRYLPLTRNNWKLFNTFATFYKCALCLVLSAPCSIFNFPVNSIENEVEKRGKYQI